MGLVTGLYTAINIQCEECDRIDNSVGSVEISEACIDFYQRGWRAFMTEDGDAKIVCPSCVEEGRP
jgi:hypothetical protein